MRPPVINYRAYSARLRAAGWENCGQGLWTKGGAKFYAWTASRHLDGRVLENWRALAERDLLPLEKEPA